MTLAVALCSIAPFAAPLAVATGDEPAPDDGGGELVVNCLLLGFIDCSVAGVFSATVRFTLPVTHAEYTLGAGGSIAGGLSTFAVLGGAAATSQSGNVAGVCTWTGMSGGCIRIGFVPMTHCTTLTAHAEGVLVPAIFAPPASAITQGCLEPGDILQGDAPLTHVVSAGSCIAKVPFDASLSRWVDAEIANARLNFPPHAADVLEQSLHAFETALRSQVVRLDVDATGVPHLTPLTPLDTSLTPADDPSQPIRWCV